MDRALHLNKFNSPSPRNNLCQVWLKLAQWFLRNFFNFVNVFSLFRNYLPLKKGGALHLNKIWIKLNPLHQMMLCVKFEICQVVLEKKIKKWKVYGQMDRRTTDDWRSEKLTWAFSWGELKSYALRMTSPQRQS